MLIFAGVYVRERECAREYERAKDLYKRAKETERDRNYCEGVIPWCVHVCICVVGAGMCLCVCNVLHGCVCVLWCVFTLVCVVCTGGQRWHVCVSMCLCVYLCTVYVYACVACVRLCVSVWVSLSV